MMSGAETEGTGMVELREVDKTLFGMWVTWQVVILLKVTWRISLKSTVQ